jgi:AcrR family transcriptional regulator
MPEQLTQMLRTDARDNRDRILEASRELFSERGIDVTMRDIARAAGVGPATLYRRFPTKQLLVDAAFADELRTCSGIVERGAADPDPWRGFCYVIEQIGVLNARNHGFVDAFTRANPQVDSFAAHRSSLLHVLAGLAQRAQASGGLRPDFVMDDLVLILLAGRGLAGVRAERREAAASRFAALAIDALRA